MLSETDALGNTTNYGYDALSRLTSVADPLERITSYVYDGADNIVTVIDANGNKVNYEYNTVGLLTKETDALGNIEQYEYYVDGLLQEITKADGTTSSYAYDLAGRMTNVDYSDGTTIDYGYNEVGSTTTMTDKTGTTTYQYDDMQRLVSTTESNDKTVSYTYDILGRRTSIVLPDGQTTNYEYDVMDRLVEVTQNSEVIAEYEYDANSQLVSNIRNDITTTYEYNTLGQLTELVNSDVNSELQIFTYQYDAIGNIIEEIRVEGNKTNNRTYQYDSANQLVEFKDNDYTETYLYDNVGNMLVKDVNYELTEYKYNEANQLINELTNDVEISYNYNANGDLTNKTTGEQYSYDIQGNLTSIVGNGIDKQYTYNGNGNRLSETTDGETIFYVNDLNRRYEDVLQTYDEDGDVINTYTYGIDRIQSAGQNDETYLYDGRGSVVGAVGSDNSVVTYAYTAYGELMPSSPVPNVYGYNAEQTDFITGQQYLRARYYDIGLGRFFQEDDYRGKFTKPSSMNRYAYTHNNPVIGIDPSGYDTLSDLNRRINALESQLSRLRSMSAYTAITAVTNELNKVKAEKKDYMATVRAQKMQEMYTNYQAADIQPVGSNGVPTAINAQNVEDVYGHAYCNGYSPYTFDELDEIIYDGMDLTKYSYSQLKDIYTAITTIDVTSDSAYTNLFSKVSFMLDIRTELDGREMAIDKVGDLEELQDVINEMTEESGTEPMTTFYSDRSIGVTPIFPVGISAGQTIVVNYEKEYVAVYVHLGAGISGCVSPVSGKYTEGYMQGNTDNSVFYTGAFLEIDKSLIETHDLAVTLDKSTIQEVRDGELSEDTIVQTGRGYVTNFGIEASISNYWLVEEFTFYELGLADGSTD